MSKQEKRAVSACDPKTASTLAAASVMQFFRGKTWKIVSFFPNSPCARTQNDIKPCVNEDKSKESI